MERPPVKTLSLAILFNAVFCLGIAQTVLADDASTLLLNSLQTCLNTAKSQNVSSQDTDKLANLIGVVSKNGKRSTVLAKAKRQYSTLQPQLCPTPEQLQNSFFTRAQTPPPGSMNRVKNSLENNTVYKKAFAAQSHSTSFDNSQTSDSNAFAQSFFHKESVAEDFLNSYPTKPSSKIAPTPSAASRPMNTNGYIDPNDAAKMDQFARNFHPFTNKKHADYHTTGEFMSYTFKTGYNQGLSAQEILGFLGMVIEESGGNPKAIGPMTRHGRALGMTQMLPTTAARYGVKNPNQLFNRYVAMDAGLRYYGDLMAHYNHNTTYANAAYNCGENLLDRSIQQAKDLGKQTVTVPLQTYNYVGLSDANARNIADPNKTPKKSPAKSTVVTTTK